MGRARVVTEPPKDYIPEPLVAPTPPPEIVEEQELMDGTLEEEVEQNEPSQEELEKERIAEELINLRHDLTRQMTIANEHVYENEMLRQENQKLTREKEAAEKVREEQILKARQQATEQRNNQHMIQLNMAPKIPSLFSKIKTVFRKRRIKSATNVGIKNYETAILERARIAVPKLLDDIEKMHEQLTILEDLLTKYSEVKSNQEK